MPEPERIPAAVTAAADALLCSGQWTVGSVGQLRESMGELRPPGADSVTIDGGGIRAMDTTGAWLLLQLRRQLEAAGRTVSLAAFSAAHQRLLDYIEEEERTAGEHVARPAGPGWLSRWNDQVEDMVDILAFIGQSIMALLTAVRHPGRIRWHELLDDIYMTGLNALPIVGLLSFLMGVVIAYQGAVQLKLYGANIYVADLVGYSMLRELAPLLTAILVCGRTGSAYAAKIGTMKVREEVDALQTMGISPVELLVLPKLMSLIIVMPLLSVYADILSVFGGMVMASAQLGIGFNAFIERLEEAISISTFMIGIGKAPVFAAIIAIVGCYQGFKVEGSAESVGRHTTIAVVQSIFMVIIVDAMFSILFSVLGI
ncbi:MAG: MlaE family lipid ABC transporter permease subunit [Thiohalobacterales bacterium]|nr:MlaE family lipid ABC transporter permease subunit [Thiohalobacterales bacterium]